MPGDAAPLTMRVFNTLTAAYLRNENDLVADLLSQIDLSADCRRLIHQTARTIVEDVRADETSSTPIDDLLLEYGLSSEEGVTLMRLAEALIRTPDFATSRSLIRDKIGGANWSAHAGKSESFLVNQATNGLRLTAAWVSSTGGNRAQNLLAKLGDQVMERAVEQAMAIMGEHFVLGRDIKQALKRARKSEAAGFAHSYDMLGEAAHTQEDADKYFEAYLYAIRQLASQTHAGVAMRQSPGLSVKLSALHPRYEYAQRETCIPVLIDRLMQLCHIARDAGLWLNIDAEEADRLEISLLVFDRLLKQPSIKDWPGLGLVVQAYQRRAIPVIDHLLETTHETGRKIAVRLVKGAYWDTEIKRAQEFGLKDYPVFTRKENTDVSYLACAAKLLSGGEMIFPQFATHNAHTAAAIAHMAGRSTQYEFQRLHGMGGALHTRLMSTLGVPSRIYAPVGTHKDLLPYLVRRLLENGANSSFVNQLMDDRVDIDDIITDPMSKAAGNASHANPQIPKPVDILNGKRLSAQGLDLTQSDVAAAHMQVAARTGLHHATSLGSDISLTAFKTVAITSPQDARQNVGSAHYAPVELVDTAVQVAHASDWTTQTTPSDRAQILQRAADLLEAEMDVFLELCVREAGKTLPDAVAEVREAIDFCRYYASQAQRDAITKRAPLGVVACISPWNFPLAIFLGQVVAALSVGNRVIAKPAEQTPLIAAKATELLYRAGVPETALHLLIGDGAALGNALTRHPDIAGICFTGSTRTAKIIAKNLADTGRATTPFIAETGGINAMIIDSTALLEQAVRDVVDSAFQSAGQRCSACRIVCVQEDVYVPFLRMLTGAMDELIIGDPKQLETDVGPVIDAAARQMIEDYKLAKRQAGQITKECSLPAELTAGHFTAPALIEVEQVGDVDREIFGPVLHLARFRSRDLDQLLSAINGLGYGLTMGLHTRLDSRIDDIARKAHVGNLYVNRNQIGAVVGVQPFGGEGLSGTGPKAGGPNYLFGLTQALPITDAPHEAAIDSAKLQPATQLLQTKLSDARKAAATWQKALQAKDDKTALSEIQQDDPAPEFGPNHIIALPGPTGEDNTLRLAPRGVFLCFGGDDPSDLIRQVSRAIASGSAAIAILRPEDTDEFVQFQKSISKRRHPKNLITHVSLIEGISLINEPIDGIIADGSLRGQIAPHVCLRPGPILPILSMQDPAARFFHERTLTINTTAAGGNASLLALD